MQDNFQRSSLGTLWGQQLNSGNVGISCILFPILPQRCCRSFWAELAKSLWEQELRPGSAWSRAPGLQVWVPRDPGQEGHCKAATAPSSPPLMDTPSLLHGWDVFSLSNTECICDSKCFGIPAHLLSILPVYYQTQQRFILFLLKQKRAQ